MNWKGIIAAYFNFSRKERIAVIVLLTLIGAVLFIPSFVRRPAGSFLITDSAWIAAARQLETRHEADSNRKQGRSLSYPHTAVSSATRLSLFPFDPNTLNEAEWKKLGLRDKTIRTILNFRAKGGQFRKPEDLQRVYGLFPDEYERLRPYIRLSTTPFKSTYPSFTEHVPREFGNKYKTVELNTVDSSALIALPGIGATLAARIIRFRDRLGGFMTVAQLKEVYGLKDSVFQLISTRLEADVSFAKKININTADVNELKSHPYVGAAVATAIVAYRTEHGPFGKVEDLKKIMAVTAAIMDKAKDYLTVSN